LLSQTGMLLLVNKALPLCYWLVWEADLLSHSLTALSSCLGHTTGIAFSEVGCFGVQQGQNM